MKPENAIERLYHNIEEESFRLKDDGMYNYHVPIIWHYLNIKVLGQRFMQRIKAV